MVTVDVIPLMMVQCVEESGGNRCGFAQSSLPGTPNVLADFRLAVDAARSHAGNHRVRYTLHLLYEMTAFPDPDRDVSPRMPATHWLLWQSPLLHTTSAAVIEADLCDHLVDSGVCTGADVLRMKRVATTWHFDASPASFRR